MTKSSTTSGLTLVETLLSTALFFTIVGLSVSLNLGNLQIVNQTSAVESIADAFIVARNNTIAGLGDDPWGVYGSGDTMIAFSGASYATRSPDFDQLFSLGEGITISTIEFRFNRPMGVILNQTTPYTINLNSNGTLIPVIIDTYGVVR